MDYIVVGLALGSVLAILGFALYEYANRSTDHDPLFSTHDRRISYSLMISALVVWLVTIMAMVGNLAQTAGLALVILTALLTPVVGVYLARREELSIPSFAVTREVEVTASDSEESSAEAYAIWPLRSDSPESIEPSEASPEEEAVADIEPEGSAVTVEESELLESEETETEQVIAEDVAPPETDQEETAEVAEAGTDQVEATDQRVSPEDDRPVEVQSAEDPEPVQLPLVAEEAEGTEPEDESDELAKSLPEGEHSSDQLPESESFTSDLLVDVTAEESDGTFSSWLLQDLERAPVGDPEDPAPIPGWGKSN